jgi:hypothetical protein
MQLYLTMIQRKVVDPGSFRLFHLENYLSQNGLQFIEPGQGDLLDLEELVLLILDLVDLILKVVELPVSKPTHQHTKHSTEDRGSDQNCGVSFNS